MKAAVITLHTVCNYGTQLQAFATQEKLKQYFDDVVFIDYRRPDTYGVGLLKTFTKKNILKAPIVLPTIIYWKFIFGKFQKNNLKFTSRKYLSDSDFQNFDDCADVYFSGSDQVWNCGWNGRVIPAMYLDFVPLDKQKYAYASSFGRAKLDDTEVALSKKYIEQFSFITVREESGVDILKKQYGFQNCCRILDPTLVMDANFWRRYALPLKAKKPYILIYNLNRSSEFDNYAKKLAKRTGLKLYRFCTRFDQIFRNGKSILIPEIFEFITLIDNAEIVLTDSFHATAFSINMGTEPICVYPNNYSGRLSEFLKLVKSEQRHITDYNDFDVVNRHVNFDVVNSILASERKKVDEYLLNVSKGVNGFEK